jgi:cell division initiation protein
MYISNDATTADRRLPAPDLAVMPLDVRQAKFPTSMRGYDREEVASFLEQAAEAFELALRDNERLRQEIARLEGSLSHFRDLEGSLKNTLMSAQKLADDMRENAAQESARLVREAEGKAEMILQKALGRLEDVQRDIDGLRMKRREAETGIEALMAALGHTLTFVREHDQRERGGDKVVPHRVARSESPALLAATPSAMSSAPAPTPLAAPIVESTPLIIQSA